MLFRSAEKESCFREGAHIWSSQHETEASEHRDRGRDRGRDGGEDREKMDVVN